jgi:hypothetical protein
LVDHRSTELPQPLANPTAAIRARRSLAHDHRRRAHLIKAPARGRLGGSPLRKVRLEERG